MKKSCLHAHAQKMREYRILSEEEVVEACGSVLTVGKAAKIVLSHGIVGDYASSWRVFNRFTMLGWVEKSSITLSKEVTFLLITSSTSF